MYKDTLGLWGWIVTSTFFVLIIYDDDEKKILGRESGVFFAKPDILEGASG